jgi:hypothetical protein
MGCVLHVATLLSLSFSVNKNLKINKTNLQMPDSERFKIQTGKPNLARGPSKNVANQFRYVITLRRT